MTEAIFGLLGGFLGGALVHVITTVRHRKAFRQLQQDVYCLMVNANGEALEALIDEQRTFPVQIDAEGRKHATFASVVDAYERECD